MVSEDEGAVVDGDVAHRAAEDRSSAPVRFGNVVLGSSGCERRVPVALRPRQCSVLVEAHHAVLCDGRNDVDPSADAPKVVDDEMSPI